MRKLLLIAVVALSGCAAQKPVAAPVVPLDCSHTDIPHCVVVEQQ